jgi:uncharacterized protein YdeI (YjbR/CyaY-like superfamily)
MSDEVALRPDRPIVEVATRAQWRTWLEEHHTQESGVWVVTRRRAALGPADDYVAATDLAEECLCFGWVDTKPAPLDASRTALLCSPRPPDRDFTKVEVTRLGRLTAAGVVVVPPSRHTA